MTKRQQPKEHIVTSFGADGACAAAMALRAFPAARIVITSTSRVAGALAELAAVADRETTVHVCGLGLGDAPEAPLAALASLSATGADITWHCGRGYLEELARDLSACCRVNFPDGRSNTEAVHRCLTPPDDDIGVRLLDLAAEFVERREKLSPDHQWWQDFIQASAARYFKYEDTEAFPACIRKLAGADAVTAPDEREVTRWRASGGKALPLGASPAMKRLRKLILRIAPLDEPVLIHGPSGAGKEMVARLLHEAGARADANFVPVNCAILSTSSDLAHDRLFGHTAGAYTGARTDGKGAFETADDGTLFLDEVAELPVDVQTQLLRVLEEGSVLPLGTMEPRPVNVRVVAATNRDLARMVEEGAFRLDLYHRLNVLRLRTPPLRERREDMPSIARSVIHGLKQKGFDLKLSEGDRKAIDAYHWPGNIRQFINILKRAAYMGIRVAEAIDDEARDPAGPHTADDGDSLFRPATPEAIAPEDDVRREYMRRCLDLCEGNRAMAARKLGVSVNTLRKWTDED